MARLDTAWMRSLSLGRLLGMAQHIPAGMALLSPGSRHGMALAQPQHSQGAAPGISAPLLEELQQPGFAPRQGVAASWLQCRRVPGGGLCQTTCPGKVQWPGQP